MSSGRGQVALLISFAGVLIGGPILLGVLWQTWVTMQESRQQAREAPMRPVRAEPPTGVALPEDVPLPPPVPLSELPLERVVGDLLEVQATSPHVDDLDPSLPYRLSWDARDGIVISATVDLGRDGTIDEWWTLRPELTREAMLDGVRRRMVIRDGAWVPE